MKNKKILIISLILFSTLSATKLYASFWYSCKMLVDVSNSKTGTTERDGKTWDTLYVRGTVKKFIPVEYVPSTCDDFRINKKVSATIFLRQKNIEPLQKGDKVILTWEHVGDVQDPGTPEWYLEGLYEQSERLEDISDSTSLEEPMSLNDTELDKKKETVQKIGKIIKEKNNFDIPRLLILVLAFVGIGFFLVKLVKDGAL